MPQILNTWKSTKGNEVYYNLSEDQMVEQEGDYAVYKEFDRSYIYTYKNVAINNLVGCNKVYLKALSEGNVCPPKNTPPLALVFISGMEAKKKGCVILGIE